MKFCTWRTMALLPIVIGMATAVPLLHSQPAPDGDPPVMAPPDPTTEPAMDTPTPPQNAEEEPGTEPSTHPATAASTQASTEPATMPFHSNSRSHHLTTYSHNAAISTMDGSRRAVLPPDLGVLAQRSIFSKDRRPASVEGEGTLEVPPPATAAHQPAESIVLTGVIESNPEDPAAGPDTYLAIFEDLRNSTRLILRVGDEVAQGHITQITLDWVEYDAAGHVQRVEVGQNLAGGAPPMVATAPAGDSNSSATGPAAATAPVESANMQTIIERMKNKRKHER